MYCPFIELVFELMGQKAKPPWPKKNLAVEVSFFVLIKAFGVAFQFLGFKRINEKTER